MLRLPCLTHMKSWLTAFIQNRLWPMRVPLFQNVSHCSGSWLGAIFQCERKLCWASRKLKGYFSRESFPETALCENWQERGPTVLANLNDSGFILTSCRNLLIYWNLFLTLSLCAKLQVQSWGRKSLGSAVPYLFCKSTFLPPKIKFVGVA